jgi:hypothetical protein
MKELKRVWFVLAVTLALVYVFVGGYYENLPAVIQLVLSKFLLVTAGVLTAHTIRKSILPEVNWNNDYKWQLTSAVIAFYLIVIYCFAMGG